jgi:rRNA biogenesis protein RRP5
LFRFTLQRGLQNLEQKHHVDLSSKFAQLEFKMGEAERGKTIFENIVGNYPKRTDQWSVYVDMVNSSSRNTAISLAASVCFVRIDRIEIF